MHNKKPPSGLAKKPDAPKGPQKMIRGQAMIQDSLPLKGNGRTRKR